MDPFRVFLCDGSLIRADICVNQCARSSACSVKAESHSDKSLQRKAPTGAKNGQKMAKNRHFLDAFRVFLCDGFLEKVDIYVNYNAGFSYCTVKARSHSDNSLQRKALNGAKNHQR